MRESCEIAKRFGQSASTYDEAAQIQREAVKRLTEQISAACKELQPERILEIGCGTGLLTLELEQLFPEKELILNDVSPEMILTVRSRINRKTQELIGDAEEISWPGADLIATSSAIQWFDNPLTVIDKAEAALSQGGIFALSTFGPQTFKELNGGTADEDNYPTLSAWQENFCNNFEILHSSSDIICQHFGSRTEMLRMLAKTGVGTRRRKGAKVPDDREWAPTLTWELIQIVVKKR